LDFPVDCKKSKYTPVLLVLDPTPNLKLNELVKVFQGAGGNAYIGDEAWKHLESVAGSVMSVFIDKYVKAPIKQVLDANPETLPDIALKMTDTLFSISIGGESIMLKRTSGVSEDLEQAES
jgi:hypothetical protein